MGDLHGDNVLANRRVRGNELAARETLSLAAAINNVGDADHTTQLDEAIVLIDSASANTVTLADDAADRGLTYIIVDIGSNAATNAITITAQSDGQHNVNGSNQDLTIDENDGMAICSADKSGDWWVGIS